MGYFTVPVSCYVTEGVLGKIIYTIYKPPQDAAGCRQSEPPIRRGIHNAHRINNVPSRLNSPGRQSFLPWGDTFAPSPPESYWHGDGAHVNDLILTGILQYLISQCCLRWEEPPPKRGIAPPLTPTQDGLDALVTDVGVTMPMRTICPYE